MRRLHALPLRVTLVAALLLLSAAGLLASGVAVTSAMERSLLDRTDRQLADAAHGWAKPQDPRTAPPLTDPGPNRPPSPFYVRITDPDGTLRIQVYDEKGDAATRIVSTPGPVTVGSVGGDGPRWRELTVAAPAGTTTVAVRLTDIDETVSRLVGLQIVIGAVVLVVLGLGAYIVVRRIEDQATRMGLIVEDLLLLARMDAQRPLERTPVDLLAIAADAVHDARALAPGRRIAVEFLPDSGPAEVLGDDVRLRQVTGNLVGNALEHTTPDADVTVRVGTAGDDAVLEVADTGPGLGPDDAARVFERFYRADGSGPARVAGPDWDCRSSRPSSRRTAAPSPWTAFPGRDRPSRCACRARDESDQAGTCSP